MTGAILTDVDETETTVGADENGIIEIQVPKGELISTKYTSIVLSDSVTLE